MEKPKITSADDPTDLLWEKGVKILTCALYFLSSFILSGAGLFSVRIPLSIGLCAACTGVELLCAAAGGILGGALRLSAGEMLCAVIPVGAITGTVFVMERTNLRKNRRLILSVTVFALHFFCSVGVMQLIFAEGNKTCKGCNQIIHLDDFLPSKKHSVKVRQDPGQQYGL